MARKYLSNQERILLHLSIHTGPVNYFNAPHSLTQEGIAESVGIGRNNVPREIKKLIDANYVSNKKARISGFRNKRNVYFLTAEGVNKVSEIKERIESLNITVITEEGLKESVILREVPEKYGIPFIAAALNINKDRTLDIMSVRKERGTVHYIEENILINGFYGRKKELELLKQWLKSDKRILVVQGIPGIGKTFLMIKFIKSFATTKNVFFIRISKNDSPLDLAYRLGKFYSKLGRPSLERYIRGVIRRRGEYNHCENIRNLIVKSIRDEILVFDNVENASEITRNAIKWLIKATDEKKMFRVAIIGSNTNGVLPVAKLPQSIHIRVDELPYNDAMKLMRNFGINEEMATKIYEKYGGNPLVLSLIKSSGESVVREYIFDGLLSSISKEERRIVEFLSVFTKPVEKGAFLRYGMEYPAIYRLIKKSIVREQEYDVYSLPRLISRFVYDRLADKKKTMYHLMAGEYYEYRHEFLDAAYHFMKGGDTARAANIIEENYEKYLYKKPGLLKSLLQDLIDAENHHDNLGAIHGIMGEILIVEGRLDEARKFIGRAMRSFENRDVNKWARYGVKLSIVLGKKGEIDEAMRISKKIIEKSSEVNNPEHLAMAHYVLGNLLLIRGDVTMAHGEFKNAVRIAEESKNFGVLGYAYNGMGIILRKNGDERGAMEYYERARQSFEMVGDAVGIIKVLRNIGHMLYVQMDPACEAYFNEALDMAREIGDMYNEALIYRDIGAWYMAQGKMEAALENLIKSKDILENIRPPEDLGWLYNTLGTFYGRMGNVREAKRYFDLAMAMATSEGHRELENAVKRCRNRYLEIDLKNIADVMESEGMEIVGE